MSSTHVSLYSHIVFSTKSRPVFIRETWQERLHSYLGGNHRLADVVRDLKACSSKWVHQVVGTPMFGWQEGYGAFSVGRFQMEDVKRYIRFQEEHHRKKTFQEEYLGLMRENDIGFDEGFLW